MDEVLEKGKHNGGSSSQRCQLIGIAYQSHNQIGQSIIATNIDLIKDTHLHLLSPILEEQGQSGQEQFEEERSREEKINKYHSIKEHPNKEKLERK